MKCQSLNDDGSPCQSDATTIVTNPVMGWGGRHCQAHAVDVVRLQLPQALNSGSYIHVEGSAAA